jgi:hypothetical protein
MEIYWNKIKMKNKYKKHVTTGRITYSPDTGAGEAKKKSKKSYDWKCYVK